MSGISQFTATALNQAIKFDWVVDSNLVTKNNIQSITLIINDFDVTKGAFSRSVTPILFTNELSGEVTGITTTYTVTTDACGNPIQNGDAYGAVLSIKAGGITYTRSLAGIARALTVPNKPNVTVYALESKIKVKLNNYTSGTHSSVGFTPLTTVHVYVANPTASTFTVSKIDATTIGTDYLNEMTIDLNDAANGVAHEVSIQTENSQGYSQMSDTFVVTPKNLPNPVTGSKAISTIEYNRDNSINANATSATVLFNNSVDQAGLLASGIPIINYKVYRYTVDLADERVLSSKTLIQTIAVDASGLSTNVDGSGVIITYNYESTLYPFRVIDSSVVLETKYIYGISATNSNGEGEEGFTNVMRAATLAAAPVISSVPGDGKLTINVSRVVNQSGNPYDPNGKIKLSIYTLDGSGIATYNLNSQERYLDASGNVEVTGLTNGTLYYYTAAAVTNGFPYLNREYTGLYATPKTSTPYGKASATSSVTVLSVANGVPLDGKLDVSWNAVTNKNGSDGAITYSVFAGGVLKASGLSTLYARITDLSNGVLTAVTVRADVYNSEIQANAPGDLSTAVNKTPFALPSDASGVTIFNTSATDLSLNFILNNVPTGFAASALRYVITDGSGATTYSSTPGQTINSVQFTGTTGSPVTYEITTGIYNSELSQAFYNTSKTSISSTFYATPQAVRNLVLMPMDGAVRMTWDAPATMRGVTLSGYNIYVNNLATPFTQLSAMPETYIVPSLTNDVSYNIQIAAYGTAFGVTGQIVGTMSNAPRVTPRVGPSAVSGLVGYPSGGQITLQWDRDPSANGYKIVKDDEPLAQLSISTQTGSGSGFSWTPETITYVAGGLTNGTAYTFKVSSFVVSSGFNIYSPDAEITKTPFAAPDQPTNLAVSVDSRAIFATWVAPNVTAGAGVAGNEPLRYRFVVDASYQDMSGSSVIATYTQNVTDASNIADLSYNVQGSMLNNGGQYIVKVLAYFIGADGGVYQSAFTSIYVKVNPQPQNVSNLVATPGNKQMLVSWSSPTDGAFYTRTGITIFRSDSSGNSTINLAANATSYTDTANYNGRATTYKVVSYHDSNVAQVAGVSVVSTSFGKPFIATGTTPVPNTENASSYTIYINKNGSNLLDYVAVGALSDASGSVKIPVLKDSFGAVQYSGSVDNVAKTEANQVYPWTIDFGTPVKAVLAIIENGAGFLTTTIPTGTTAFNA